jgi:hypothetical protein
MKAHGSRGSEFAPIQPPNKNWLDTFAWRERGEDDDSESDSCSELRTTEIDWSFRLAKALTESGEQLRSCFTSLSKLLSPRSTSLERWSNDVLRAWALPIEVRNPRSEHSRLFNTQTFLPSERGAHDRRFRHLRLGPRGGPSATFERSAHGGRRPRPLQMGPRAGPWAISVSSRG